MVVYSEQNNDWNSRSSPKQTKVQPCFLPTATVMDGPREVASKIRVRSGAEATIVLPCVRHTACTRLPKSTLTLSDFHGTVCVVLGRSVHLYP